MSNEQIEAIETAATLLESMDNTVLAGHLREFLLEHEVLTAGAPFSAEDSLKQQAEAWSMVFQQLETSVPGWRAKPGLTMHSACVAIHNLAAKAGCTPQAIVATSLFGFDHIGLFSEKNVQYAFATPGIKYIEVVYGTKRRYESLAEYFADDDKAS